MKRNLNRLYHYNSLLRVMDSHPEVFEGRSGLLESKAELEKRTGRLSEIISELSSPLCLVYSRKKVAECELNEAMIKMTNLGCLDAHLRNDASMLAVMKTYRSQLRKVSCSTLYYNARHTARMLRGVSTSVTDKNFHSVALPAFSIQVAEFGRVLEEEAAALQKRKVLRSEMAALIATTNKFLHEQFDTLAFVIAGKHSEYYREWVVLRGDGSRKRRKTTRAKDEKLKVAAPAPRRILSAVVDPVLQSKSCHEESVSCIQEVVGQLPPARVVTIPATLRKMLPALLEQAVCERPALPAEGFRLIKCLAADDPGGFILRESSMHTAYQQLFSDLAGLTPG